MSIAIDKRLTAGGGGTVTYSAPRTFDALVLMVHIKPVGSVNAASRAAISVVGGSGRTIISNVNISAAITPVAIGGTAAQFSISDEETLTVAITGATEGNIFQLTAHILPLT